MSSTPLGAVVSRAGEDQLIKMENEIVSRWRSYEEDGHLTDNLSIMVAVGNRAQGL